MKITQCDVSEERDFIRKKVIEHNEANLPEEVKSSVEKMNFIARNKEDEIIGGLTTTSFWQSLQIDFLWVDPSVRGQRVAEKLMAQAEGHARNKKYHLIVVDTFSFQAPDFYRKQGFTEFGNVNDHPKGHSHHYFEKRLIDPTKTDRQ